MQMKTIKQVSISKPQLSFQEEVSHPALVAPHRAEVPPGHVPDQDQEDPHGGGRGGVSLDVVFSWFAAQLNLVHVSLMSAVYHVQPKQQIKHSLLGYHSFNINVDPEPGISELSRDSLNTRTPCCAARWRRWSSSRRAPWSTPRCRWWSLWEGPSPAPSSSRTSPLTTTAIYRVPCPGIVPRVHLPRNPIDA